MLKKNIKNFKITNKPEFGGLREIADEATSTTVLSERQAVSMRIHSLFLYTAHNRHTTGTTSSRQIPVPPTLRPKPRRVRH